MVEPSGAVKLKLPEPDHPPVGLVKLKINVVVSDSASVVILPAGLRVTL